MADGLNLDPWWDEPAYKAAQAQGTFSERGTFILNKLAQYNAVKLSTVIADLYRDEPPDPMDITKFQWQTILAYMGASEEEIRCGWDGYGGDGDGPRRLWRRGYRGADALGDVSLDSIWRTALGSGCSCRTTIRSSRGGGGWFRSPSAYPTCYRPALGRS